VCFFCKVTQKLGGEIGGVGVIGEKNFFKNVSLFSIRTIKIKKSMLKDNKLGLFEDSGFLPQ
jgi:hypothetical protein